MKILFVQGNAHNNQRLVIKALIDEGHSVCYVQPGREVDLPASYPPRCQWAQIRKSWISTVLEMVLGRWLTPYHRRVGRYADIPNIRDTWRLLSENTPDLLIIKRFFPFFAVVSLIARIRGVKVILYDQKGLFSHRSGKVGLFLERVGVKPRPRFTPVIGYPEAPQVVRLRGAYIPFIAPDVDEGLARGYLVEGCLRVLMVGCVNTPRKRAEDLIRAFLKLAPHYNVKLTIAGKKPEAGRKRLANLFNEIEKKGLSSRIQLVSGLDWGGMKNLYLTHDLFVLPSINEPASYSQLEAMSLGLPVILSDLNKSRCYVHPGVNGEVFEGANWQDLSSHIEAFLREPERVKDMGRASAHLAATHYSTRAFLRRFHRIVNVVNPEAY